MLSLVCPRPATLSRGSGGAKGKCPARARRPGAGHARHALCEAPAYFISTRSPTYIVSRIDVMIATDVVFRVVRIAASPRIVRIES
jgi:hypothetical protein